MNSESGTARRIADSSSSQQPANIRTRAFAYVLRAIKLYGFLQHAKNGAGWILGKQYLRAATSIGANIEEAQAGESRADFIHKLGLAQKEARESLYWLHLLAESEMVPKSNIQGLIQETDEIIAVITAIIVKSKRSGVPRIRRSA